METEPEIKTERVDDFVLLIEQIKNMGLPEIIDQHIPRHWLNKGLSWGWVAAIWLSHIISQGDHRKLTVRDWVRQAHDTLERVTGLSIRDTDFTDDRLTILLRELSKPEYRHKIETESGQRSIRVYNPEQKQIRLDATTVSGYHDMGEKSLFQFGNSKDDPALRQIRIMMATLDPSGLPLVTDVVSGERADDGLYIPVIDRAQTLLTRKGLLFVGDCKMSAFATRTHIHHLGHHYLSPLPMTGETAELMPVRIQQAPDGSRTLVPIYGPEEDKNGKKPLLGSGYEFDRTCKAEADGQPIEWLERVFIVCSDQYSDTMEKGLEKRPASAISKLESLTPARSRGKRQIKDEDELLKSAQAILNAHKVQGLIRYGFERQEEIHTKFVGRGRGGENREKETTSRVRYQIISIDRQEEAISELKKTFGWKAFVSDESTERLSLEAAVLTYRGEWTIERGFHRLKGAPLSMDPVFVKRNDQIEGLANLLSIAIRVLTLIEFVIRRGLKENNEKLAGLHPENPKKMTDRPTAERILKAFSKVTLTIANFSGKNIRHVTPLSSLQSKILELLGLGTDIYSSLAANSS